MKGCFFDKNSLTLSIDIEYNLPSLLRNARKIQALKQQKINTSERKKSIDKIIVRSYLVLLR